MEKKKFGAEIGKVLNLMINALYTNKDIFLRELISNASDACDKLRYLSLQDSTLTNEGHSLAITIAVDTENNILSISDNGIGMNQTDMIENLGTIASSGTQKFLEKISSGEENFNLIGQFGVGFYSAFMVAKEVTVISRKAGEDTTYKWHSMGDGEFEVGEANQDEYLASAGTVIHLKIKSKEEKYLDKFNLRHIISTYSDHIAFPIKLVEAATKDTQADDEGGGADNVINRASALWMQPKSDITDDQYNEFYRYIAHQPDQPWMRIHNKVEGNVEYTSLLFIPSTRPFDLFHPDRKTRIKLYIKRVFITDETVKIIPQYLRFMRGVVDSEDLPLNISRETIQHSKVLEKIGNSLVKKILTELKKIATDQPEKYTEFWLNFGEVLKEGLCEHGISEKSLLLEICRFHSTTSDALTSFDDYISRMLEGQKKIFFLTGDDVQKLKSHPSLEGFNKRNIEVLLLADHVDDFWVNVINQYKDFELTNINSTNIDLDQIQKLDDTSDSESKGTEDLMDQSAHDKTTVFFKEVLGGVVQKVITTNKLVDSPACLAIPEGYMSLRMEKMMLEQKQLKSAVAKILEINPSHFLVKRINDTASSNHDKASELVWLVYDQACILEGEKVSDPKAFVTRLNSFLN